MARKKRAPLKYLMIAPALIVILVVVIYPLIYSLYLSFNSLLLTTPGKQQMEWIGLGNYIDLLRDDLVYISLKNTAVFTIAAVAIEFLVGLLLALIVNRGIKFDRTVTSVLLIPMMVASVAAGLMWRYLLHEQLGAVNAVIQWIGFSPLNFRSDPLLAMPTIVACDVWQWTPFMFLLMLAGLQSLPRAPFEAATIDGASSLQTFRHITLQLMRPVILIALTLRTIDAIKTFDMIYTLTRGGPGTLTEVISYYIYRLGFWFYNLGKASAYSYVLLIIISVLCYVMIRQLRAR